MSKVEQLTEIIMPALTNRFQLNILHNNKSFDSLKYQLIKMQEDSTKKEITLIFEVDISGDVLVDSMNLIHESKNCVIVMSACGVAGDICFGIAYEKLSSVTKHVTDQLIWDYSICKSQLISITLKYDSISIATGNAAKEILNKS
jgi:hypothetical protein